MTGSSGGSTTTTQSGPPAQVLAAYQNLTNAATNQAQQPLRQYTGPMIAGFTPAQQQGFGEIGNAQGIGTPYINAAAQEFGTATTPLWPTLPQYSSGTVNQYLSPYTQDVTGALTNLYNQQNAQQQSSISGNAAMHGAYGGDREAVAQALAAQQENLAQAPTLAQVEQQGFQGAQGEFNTQQQQQLAAEQANAWLASQAGFGMAGLGQQAQNQALTGANALISSGGLQQQLGQETLNVPYEQFIQQQAYPYQQLGFLAPIVEGTGSLSGGKGSTTYPGPSAISQIGGLGLAGAGIYGLGSQQGWWGGGSTPSIGDANWTGGGAPWDWSGYSEGGRISAASGGRIGYAMGGTMPMVPGVPAGPEHISLDYIPQSAPGGTPTTMGLSPFQPDVKQTTQSGGGGGILGALGPLISIGKFAAGFFADGGRIHLDDGGIVGLLPSGTVANHGSIGLPPVPHINLDYITNPGPAVKSAGVKGEGPPKPPSGQPPQQDQGMGGLIGEAKGLKDLGVFNGLGSSSSSDTNAATAANGGRIGFAGGGSGGPGDDFTGYDVPSYSESDTPPGAVGSPDYWWDRELRAGGEEGMPREDKLVGRLSLMRMNRDWPRDESKTYFGYDTPPLNVDVPMDRLPELRRGGRAGFADGGMSSEGNVPVSVAAQFGGAPPNVSGALQQLMELPIDRLQQMAVQFPPTTQQGQMVAQALARKKATVGAGTAPQPGPQGAPAGMTATGLGTAPPQQTASAAQSPQDYGGTSHAMAEGGSAGPGFVTEDELDPHPIVDHSGDTVKIRYPSEGKVLDLGIPSIKERRNLAAGGSSGSTANDFPQVGWSGGQWSVNNAPSPANTGHVAITGPANNAPLLGTSSAENVPGTAAPFMTSMPTANGVAIPQMSASAFAPPSGVAPGAGLPGWFNPMPQYHPTGSGMTGPGGTNTFPSAVAFEPQMGGIISGLSPGAALPVWAGGSSAAPAAAASSVVPGGQQSQEDAFLQLLQDSNASAGGGNSRGGRIGFADGGEAPVPINPSPADALADKLKRIEDLHRENVEDPFPSFQRIIGNPTGRPGGGGFADGGKTDDGDYIEPPPLGYVSPQQTKDQPPPRMPADRRDDNHEPARMDDGGSVASDVPLGTDFPVPTDPLYDTGDFGKLGKSLEGVVTRSPIGAVDPAAQPAWLKHRYDVDPNKVVVAPQDTMPATVLPPPGLGGASDEAPREGRAIVGSIGSGGLGGDSSQPSAPAAMVTPDRAPPGGIGQGGLGERSAGSAPTDSGYQIRPGNTPPSEKVGFNRQYGTPYNANPPGGVPAGTPGAGPVITKADADRANAEARAADPENKAGRMPTMPTDFVWGKGLVAPPGGGIVTPAPAATLPPPTPGLAPGFSRDARGNLTQNGKPPDTYIGGAAPGGGALPAWNAPATAPPPATGGERPPTGYPDPRGVIPLIRAAAQKYGIDPNTAVRVASTEGLTHFASTIPGEKSYAAFQLNMLPGSMGAQFQKETGLDPADPKNEPATIDYAMREAAKVGWTPFHGAARANIGPWDGIGGRPATGGGDQMVGPGTGRPGVQPSGTGTNAPAPPVQQASDIAKTALAHTAPEHRGAMAEWMNSPYFLAFLAGAGMLASRSPFPGVALGEGLKLAAQGAETMAGQQNRQEIAEIRAQHLNDLTSVRLSAEADKASNNTQMLQFRYDNLARQAQNDQNNIELHRQMAAASAALNEAKLEEQRRKLEEARQYHQMIASRPPPGLAVIQAMMSDPNDPDRPKTVDEAQKRIAAAKQSPQAQAKLNLSVEAQARLWAEQDQKAFSLDPNNFGRTFNSEAAYAKHLATLRQGLGGAPTAAPSATGQPAAPAQGATSQPTPGSAGAPVWARGSTTGANGTTIYTDGKSWFNADHTPYQVAQ